MPVTDLVHVYKGSKFWHEWCIFYLLKAILAKFLMHMHKICHISTSGGKSGARFEFSTPDSLLMEEPLVHFRENEGYF